jgi:hypothetical protein
VLRDYETIHVNVGIEYFQSERLTSIKAKTGDSETPLAAYLAGVDGDDPKFGSFVRARRYHRLIIGWARELWLEADDGPAPWPSDPIDRKATGLTLIDLARGRRDARLRHAMQERFCGQDQAGLIDALDRRLRGQAPSPSFDAESLITLDGRLVYTLWALGRRKGLVHSLLEDEAPQETVETILAFADSIDRLGPSLFGYTFDASREVLAAHQHLDRLDAVEPVFE